MVLNKAEVDRLLSDADAPNVPAAIPAGGDGAGGQRIEPFAVGRELRLRRRVMADLLARGRSRDEIMEQMTRTEIVDEKGKTRPGFGMTEREVDRLIVSVRAEWDEEETEQKRYARAAAVRRLLSEINQARSERSYNAVANLEKVLMMVQGTAEPIEVATPTDGRITDALLRVLGELDPVAVRELIERERAVDVEPTTIVTMEPKALADTYRKGRDEK